MARHLLDAKKVEKARPRVKAYRLADGDGLYLYVPPSGVRAWQYRYRHDGKPQTATLGKLSYMSLAEARTKAGRVTGCPTIGPKSLPASTTTFRVSMTCR